VESGVRADDPAADLQEDVLNTSKISNEVHEIVDDSAVSNLIHFHSEIHLSNKLFGAFWC